MESFTNNCINYNTLSSVVNNYVVSFCSTEAKSLKDSETLASLGFTKKSKLYFKDLGPQVGWTTVSYTYLQHSPN